MSAPGFTSYPDALADWHLRGDLARVFGHEVFFVDSGGPGPVLLLVHGFPTCSFDFHRVFDRLAKVFRVIAHDQLGFGFSAKPRNYSYSLLEQAEVAIELWRALGISSAHVVGHDYGTSVVTELLARRERGLLPTEIDSVTLSNGSIHLELAKLRLTQRVLRHPVGGPWLARMAGRAFFKRRLRSLWGDPARIDDADLDALWLALEENNGREALPKLSSYLDERVRFRTRWVGALEHLDVPTHILWGRRDPIAVPAIAETLAGEIANARLTWLDSVGHFPMLEAPDDWSRAILGFHHDQSSGG